MLTYPVTCPGPGFDATDVKSPIVIDGMSGVTISGVKITNPQGPCISIKGSASVTIKDSVLGPCKDAGVSVESSSDVHVENSYIFQTGSNGVDLYQVTGATIERSCIDTVSSGIYAQESTAVVVEQNAVKNVQGPFPRGQLVQFNGVTGDGNRVRCNVIDNVFGASNPEDNINMFQSKGTAASPILIEGNRIRGGGPSTSGGGILLGDGGDSDFQIARDNVLVAPGQYGVAVASGTNQIIEGNKIRSVSKPWSNVGVYVWNQYDSACGPVSVTKNVVDWTNKDGTPNGVWDSSQSPSDPTFPVCAGTVFAGDNDFSATLSDDVVMTPPASCP